MSINAALISFGFLSDYQKLLDLAEPLAKALDGRLDVSSVKMTTGNFKAVTIPFDPPFQRFVSTVTSTDITTAKAECIDIFAVGGMVGV